jgi:ParB family chromosome partitioning protein
MKMMNVTEIKTSPTFEKLFPIKEGLLEAIATDMRENQFDLSQPVILASWDGQKELVCIDGHTRLQAAINAGIEQVPVWIREDFETEEAALAHAIKLQRNRRNMTDAELMSCIEVLDKIRPRGRHADGEPTSKMPQGCGKESGRSASAKETAEIVGCSSRKVEQARTVENHASAEILDAVKKGEMSINKAYQETQKKRKEDSKEEPESCNDVEEAQEEPEESDSDGKATDEQAIDPVDHPEKTDPPVPVMANPEAPKSPPQGNDDPERYVKIRISAEHYDELSQYEGDVEDLVSEAIDRHLEYLEEKASGDNYGPDDEYENYAVA